MKVGVEIEWRGRCGAVAAHVEVDRRERERGVRFEETVFEFEAQVFDRDVRCGDDPAGGRGCLARLSRTLALRRWCPSVSVSLSLSLSLLGLAGQWRPPSLAVTP